jgi:hypothetical protein
MIRHLALPVFLLVAAPCLAPCLADEAPSFVLTTDTPAYCTQLAKQVEARHSTLMDVQRLLAEGRDLCDRGQIRGGIRRLRRALVILHHRVVKEEPATP